MGGGESNAMRVAILDQVNGLYLGDGMPVLLYLQCQTCLAAPGEQRRAKLTSHHNSSH